MTNRSLVGSGALLPTDLCARKIKYIVCSVVEKLQIETTLHW